MVLYKPLHYSHYEPEHQIQPKHTLLSMHQHQRLMPQTLLGCSHCWRWWHVPALVDPSGMVWSGKTKCDRRCISYWWQYMINKNAFPVDSRITLTSKWLWPWDDLDLNDYVSTISWSQQTNLMSNSQKNSFYKSDTDLDPVTLTLKFNLNMVNISKMKFLCQGIQHL